MALSLGSVASACITELEVEDASELEASTGSLDDLATESEGLRLEYDDALSLAAVSDPTSSLSCTQDNDCRSSCECDAGVCSPAPGVSPPPPQGYCDAPPTRSCSSDSDCRDVCFCNAGTCEPNGIGPISPNPDCHLPPADDYEYDDTWPNYSSYTGPQSHNFHTATDADWTAVYIGAAGLVRFRTHGLSYGADTRIKVFAWDGITMGALLGTNDDIGGPWYWPDSKSSRVDLPVAAGSAFLIKVINESDPSIYTTSHQWPSYTLELSYL